MKKLLLFNALFLTSLFSMGQPNPCETIFISEYVEGWQNNKAIELYNPTNQSIDLSDYRLDRYSNGSSSAAPNQKLVLQGIMPPLSVYVIVLDRRDPDGTGQNVPVWEGLQEKANLFASPVFEENNSLNFNGNDAVVLTNIAGGGNGFTWDMVGLPGQDPGLGGTGEGGWNDVGPDFTWIANGAQGWTRDHSLIRKSSVTFGQFSPVDPWDVSVQWDSIAAVVRNADGIVTGGNWASLGSHTCDCGTVVSVNEIDGVKFDIYPNPVIDQFTITAETGLSQIEIYDMTGKRIIVKNDIHQKSFKLNTGDWNPGYYLVNIRFDNDYVITKKILKQ